MRGLWSRWVARLAHQEPATGLALFRMVMGVILLVDFVLPMAIGVDSWVFATPEEGGILPLSDESWLVQALGGPSLQTSRALCAVGAVGSVALILGVGHRAAALVTLQAALAIDSLGATASDHTDLQSNALWLLLLAPAAETLSLRCWLKTHRWTSDTAVAAWPRYLLVAQIANTYFWTGVMKLGPGWWPWDDFTAVYRMVNLPEWGRFDMVWVAWIFPLTQVATVVTLVWEMTWPVVLLALWFRATRDRPGRLRRLSNRLDVRSIYVVIGILMHGVVFATTNVGAFSATSAAFYLCCYHPDEYARLWRRLRGRPA